jgi:uncharacterized membrane protein
MPASPSGSAQWQEAVMEDWLHEAIRVTATLIEAMALIVVVIGTVEAFCTGLWTVIDRSATSHARRYVWIRYGRWLIAGLTFQLAADIIATSASPNWQDIGQLAAIAVVRTFLNFFLERDLEDIRARDAKV